ncbi:CHAT domain-containing protein [Fusarium redolens]|uniref:CHAT domain-containing protein n=1 Tax=Fusarium redolens TaxID=48865 RepID=A0A9P9JKW4_FUSRE|nr:CHAT domain-containing protein [Fusarium redolens]KAH7213308.1 CHAT domain-containing protein [Fusarium redolens]
MASDLTSQLEHAATLIASQEQDEELVPDGQFCRNKDFLKDVDPETCKYIYAVMLSDRSERARRFSMASEEVLMTRGIGTNTSGLKDAATLGALAVFNVLKSDPMRGVVVSMFGRVLRRQWEVATPDTESEALDRAVEYLRKAVEFGPRDQSNRALHLDDLGDILTQRYKASHQEADFQDASVAFHDALATDFPGKPIFYLGLAKLQQERALFEKEDQESLFRDSMATLQLAEDSVPSQFDSTPFRYTVADIHRARAACFVHLYDLNQEIENLRKAKASLNRGLAVSDEKRSKDRFNCLINLASLQQKLNEEQNVRDPSAEIGYLRQALRVHPNSTEALEELANALGERAEQNNHRETQEEADRLVERMNEIQINEPSSKPPARLIREAGAHEEQFSKTGSLHEIDQAIKCLQEALDHPDLQGHQQINCYQQLAIALLLRFEARGDKDDLRNACQANLDALPFLNDLEGPMKARCLRASGRTAFVSAQIPGQERFIDGALTAFLAAKDLASRTDPLYHTVANDIGNAYIVKCQCTGDAKLLSQATEAYQDGLDAWKEQGSSDSAMSIMLTHGIGNTAMYQFKFSGRLEDINTAIKSFEKCLDSTGPTEVRAGSRTRSLSHALQLRYNDTEDVRDVVRAGQIVEDVLGRNLSLPPVEISALHNMLGTAYLRQYHRDEDLGFLAQAEKNFNKALSCGCTDKFYLFSARINLTRTLQYRAKKTHNLRDLRDALVNFQECISMGGMDDINRGGLLINQAELFIAIYTVSPAPLSTVAANAYLIMTAQFSSAPGIARHVLAWMKVYASMFAHVVAKDSIAARNYIREAAEDLPFAVYACTTRADQLRQAKKFQAVPTLALCFSIAAGDSLVEALQLYERSRCVLWEEILNKGVDSGLDKLNEVFPDLARRFIEARNSEKVKGQRAARFDLDKRFLQSQTAFNKSTSFQELIAEIRTKEGFEDFLRLPREYSHFHELAETGPIVIVESEPLAGGYALIITSTEIQKISLPKFTVDDIREHKQLFRSAIDMSNDGDAQGGDLLHYLLTWLWEVVAEPILLSLGYNGSPKDGDLPRVWWLTTSSINTWPIHAAGDHRRAVETGEPCTVLDRCVPSYTNTLRGLSFVRGREKEIMQQSGHQKAMLVKMETTDHLQPLQHASAEVDTINTILTSTGFPTTVHDRPVRKEALLGLLDSHIAHFACHGKVDDANPARSGLLLRDWWKQDTNGEITRGNVLDVQSMMSAPKKLNCALIYVSACETAITGDPMLPEESIHLAAGFQMAGVPCVVASLWKAEDETCGLVSKVFYGELLEEGRGITGDRSARALRLAVLEQRQAGVDPGFWATWVHYGP